MKSLIVLVLVQTGVLLVLFGKIVAIENRMPVAGDIDKNTRANDVFNVRSADDHASESYSYPNELQLRNIIREELAAFSIATKRSDDPAGSAVTSETEYTDENQYQRDYVTQQLDYFESVGRISDAEMQNLQQEIVKLHPADRKRMLNRLIRTMNAGDIDGRL